MQMKLGKQAPKNDPRTLKLANYLPVHLPPPPVVRDWTNGTKQWGEMLNDQHGDCVFAGIGHAIQLFTSNTTGLITIGDPVILSYYQNWAGYKLGDESTDNGAVEIDILNRWRKEGFAGHKLLAYAQVYHKNLVHVKQAICLFGGLYLGMALPESCEYQQVWDVAPDDKGGKPGSMGGHCVEVAGYNPTGPYCITWGEIKQMTWEFFLKYCDESYALLAQDWLPHFGDKIDMTALMNDLHQVST